MRGRGAELGEHLGNYAKMQFFEIFERFLKEKVDVICQKYVARQVMIFWGNWKYCP